MHATHILGCNRHEQRLGKCIKQLILCHLFSATQKVNNETAVHQTCHHLEYDRLFHSIHKNCEYIF